MEQLKPWIFPQVLPAFNEVESVTALEGIHMLHGAMNQLIEEYNQFNVNITKIVNDFIDSEHKDNELFKTAIRQEFQDFIDVINLKIQSQDAKIQDAVDYMKNNIEAGLTDLIRQLNNNGELDALLTESFNNLNTKVDENYNTLDTKIGELSNPNLLINSDFRNPINQRGATFYDNSTGNNVYTIDRWRINGLEVTVNEGSIKIENKAASSRNFLQPFEFSLRNDVYTASCNVLAVSGQVRMFYGSYSNDLHVGVNTFTFPQAGMNMFIIVVDAGASVTLEWIKLEPGSIATPSVPRPIGEELALCQRYYREYNDCFIGVATKGLGAYYMPLMMSMRTRPTITKPTTGAIAYESTDLEITDFYLHAKTDNDMALGMCLKVASTTVECGAVYIDGKLVLDSEIY